MDTFYSQIAAEVGDEWSLTQVVSINQAYFLKTKSQGLPNERADLDDLLDGFEFSEKANPKPDTLTANSTLDTSFGNFADQRLFFLQVHHIIVWRE